MHIPPDHFLPHTFLTTAVIKLQISAMGGKDPCVFHVTNWSSLRPISLIDFVKTRERRNACQQPVLMQNQLFDLHVSSRTLWWRILIRVTEQSWFLHAQPHYISIKNAIIMQLRQLCIMQLMQTSYLCGKYHFTKFQMLYPCDCVDGFMLWVKPFHSNNFSLILFTSIG